MAAQTYEGGKPTFSYITLHFMIPPFGKFGPPYPGKATAAATAALPSPTGSFRVSVIHRTLTWTTGSLTCVRT